MAETVEAGAAIGYMQPFSLADGRDFFTAQVFPEVRAGRRKLLAATLDGETVGSVQLIVALPPNQPHRCDYTAPPPPPPVEICDFITFGRLVTEIGGKKVVISGNAGGNNADGSIKNEFHIEYLGVDYHVANATSYGAIASGALSGPGFPNSRVVTGIAKNGTAVELRLWDGGEPGKGTDKVWFSLNGSVKTTGADGQFIDQGNMQYHANCRGPKT
jgi:hypothetical protein